MDFRKVKLVETDWRRATLEVWRPGVRGQLS